MLRSFGVFLWDVIHAIHDTFEFIGEKDFSSYEHDRFLQAAVERKLTIIGEALRQAGERFPEEALGLETIRGFVGFQAFLTQNYAHLNPKYVWEAVQLLPELRTKVMERIAKLDPDE